MKHRDKFSGFFWLAIAIFVCWESIRIGMGTFRSPGPGFFPFWAAVTLGAFATIIVVKSVLMKKIEGKVADLWKGVERNKVIIVLCSLCVYIPLLPTLGYLITTFGLMVLLFGIIGKTRIWIRIVNAFVSSLVSYIIFHILLSIPLPKGIFYF